MSKIDFMATMVGAFFGSPSAIIKAGEKILKAPFDLRNKFFWDNYEYFLSQIKLTDNEREELRNKLVVDGDYEENTKRIIYTIYNVDMKKKIDYIVYATRSLMDEKISVDDYFRICNTIVAVIYEDLVYLKDNIDKKELDYNMSVQALLNVGVVTRGQDPTNPEYSYFFTPYAEKIYKFAICPEDHHNIAFQNPKPASYLEETSKDEIRGLFNK